MRSTTAYQVPRYIYLRVPYTRYVYCICTTGSDPIPGDDFVRHYIIGMFSEGIFRLLGFIVLFELLNQVISHCPKMYRLLWYEYDYQHDITISKKIGEVGSKTQSQESRTQGVHT